MLMGLTFPLLALPRTSRRQRAGARLLTVGVPEQCVSALVVISDYSICTFLREQTNEKGTFMSHHFAQSGNEEINKERNV